MEILGDGHLFWRQILPAKHPSNLYLRQWLRDRGFQVNELTFFADPSYEPVLAPLSVYGTKEIISLAERLLHKELQNIKAKTPTGDKIGLLPPEDMLPEFVRRFTSNSDWERIQPKLRSSPSLWFASDNILVEALSPAERAVLALDLHGLNGAAAEAVTDLFLQMCLKVCIKRVRIITGKAGGHSKLAGVITRMIDKKYKHNVIFCPPISGHIDLVIVINNSYCR